METLGFLKEITEKVVVEGMPGDWTAGGLYTPDQIITEVAGLSPEGLHWRQLFIKLGESPELIPVPLDSANHSIIICQFIGPSDCWTEPPVPSVNMTREWDLRQHYLAQAVYHCLPGHFVNNSNRSSEIIVSCLAQLGGWYPVALPLCLPYDVCLGDVPLPPSPQFTNVTDSNFRHLNGSVHFFCPDGRVTLDGTSLQIVTCTLERENFVFMPNVVQDCYAVCSEEPVVANATIDWVNTTWIVGDVVNATCLPGYHVTPGTDTQLVNCTADGWQSTPCYQACVDPPPPGVNMIMEVITKNAVGAVLNFTCETGFWIPTNQMNPVVTNVSSVVCSSEQTWVPTMSLECIKMCTENPVQLPEYASSTWDNFTRTVGTVVEVSCAENMLFANFSQTLRVTCREDGTWTNLDASILMCKAGTYMPPSVPLDQNTSTILEGPHPPYSEGSSMNYSCQPGTISLTGVSFITLYFTAAGWSEFDPGFECVPGTMDSPPLNLANSATLVGPGPPYEEGATLNYTCKPGLFISTGATYITITYTAGKWIPSPHPACQKG
ncbi:complement factor H-like [Panulirus ornatus]|uniref:complement factor H-like n=1 Tax=Panulirus ornatus TaxID=150431 RepID=UPI003A878BFD